MLDTWLPERLPPPPAPGRRTRLARGSVPPADLFISVRPIEAPESWSRIVPVSANTGLPLLARDRRPDDDNRLLDQVGALAVGLLATAMCILAVVLYG